MDSRQKLRLWGAALLIWGIIILILTIIPGEAMVQPSGHGTRFRWDYPEHFAAYFLLALFYYLWRRNSDQFQNRRDFRILIIAGLAASAGTEVLQLFVPNRTFNPVDMGFNTLGIAAMALLWRFALR